MKRIYKLSLLLATALSLTSCADWFQGKIDMDTTTETGSLIDLLKPDVKVTSLDCPDQIFASQAMYAGVISVNWKAVENATSYILERAVIEADANGKFPELKTTDDWDSLEWKILREYCYSTTYQDTVLSNPSHSNPEYKNRYAYRVTAQNIARGLSSDSTNPFTLVKDHPEDSNDKGYYVTNSEKMAIGYLFSAPTNVEASKGASTDSITINWTGVGDATYYRIYRDTREDFTSAAFIDSVRGNITSYSISVYNDEDKGKEFYFKVIAQNSLGNNSAYSSQAMGYALQAGAPSKPDGVKVVDGLGKSTSEIKISWNDTQTSNDYQQITYSVYRNSSANSVFTLVKKDIPSTEKGSGENSIVDSANLSPNVYYYYYVQTVSYSLSGEQKTGEVLKSAFSDSGIDSEEPAVGYILSTPSSFECTDSEEAGKVKLVWTPACGTNISTLNPALTDNTFTYNIYSSDSLDGTYSLLEENVTGSEYSGGYLYCNVAKNNFYKIKTVNSDGLESAFSNAAAPQPDAPVNVTASKTKNLANISPDKWTPNANEVYPVLIEWSAPSTDPKPVGYYIERSTKPNGAFRKITEEIITDTKFIDDNPSAKSGVFYYYRVISLNSLGQGKKCNNPEDDDPSIHPTRNRESWGYGALTRNQWFREYNKEVATSQAKLVLMHKSNDLDKVGSETIYAFLPTVSVNSTGTLGYKAAVAGLGAEITMPYKNYGDHTIVSNGKLLGISFVLNGNTDTTSNMSANGNMHETVRCYHHPDLRFTKDSSYTFTDVNSKNGGTVTYTGEIYDYVNKTKYSAKENDLYLFVGMYPGKVIYNNLQIKSGAAGGGYYLVTTYELSYDSQSKETAANEILSEDKVDWLVGEEIRN